MNETRDWIAMRILSAKDGLGLTAEQAYDVAERLTESRTAPTMGSVVTLDDYQDAAVRTMARDLDPQTEMSVLALGLAGEAGEVADIVKKLLGHGHPFTDEVRAKLAKECGDVLWYVATFSQLILGKGLGHIALGNIEKLRERYPDGFSAERSLNR